MPAARNQAEAVRRFSRQRNTPKKTDQKRSRLRRSRTAVKSVMTADTRAGIVHNDIAGPPDDGVNATPSCGEARHLSSSIQTARTHRKSRRVQSLSPRLEDEQ